MDKLKVLVGLVYTQLMFCDEHGKLHFYRVMTDADRPWLGIKEVLRMVRQALCMDKPIDYNLMIQSVHIDIQYRKVHFDSILEKLHEEMECYLSGGCEIFIKTTNDKYEVFGERTEEKVEDWRASIWRFNPSETLDYNEEPDIIEVLRVQHEWYLPLICSEYGAPMQSYGQYKPFKERIMGGELLLGDKIPTLFIVGGPSNWKKENDLRGSPDVSGSYYRESGGCSRLETYY